MEKRDPDAHLAVVVLNWNNAPDSIRTVASLLAWTSLRPLVVVVDNASVDGSADAIATACPGAVLIRSPINRGFAGGNNLGIEEALRRGAGMLLLMNNDATISEGDASLLVAALRRDASLGLLGPLVHERLGGREVITAGGRDISLYPLTRVTLRPGPGARETDGPRPVEYVPGTVVLIRAAVFRVVGGLDENFFFSGEIADFSRRARDGGFACAVHPRALAVHVHGSRKAHSSRLHGYYTLRNRFLFIRRHRPDLRALLFPYWVGIGLLMAAAALARLDPAKARVVVRALADGLSGRYGNQNARALHQGRRGRPE